MYANSNSSGSHTSNDNSNNIPEWKKKLIMKKRAGSSVNIDEHCRRNPGMLSECNCDNNDNFSSNVKICRSTTSELEFQEVSPLKTVTIGNFNVELRSVKSAIETQDSSADSGKIDRLTDFESENEDCQDLQYGPGIVDRLRERFLNMGVKKQRKPVRRFSSLENLPCSYVRPFKLNTRNIRQNGFKVGSGNFYGSGNVKKAQSMETLIYSTPEQQIFSACRRPNTRVVGGVKARILAKNLNPIMYTGEIDEPSEKSPSPVSSPRLKSVRRWDYNRSTSAPSINEDELPKPDTVKHVKKLFEASDSCAEKSVGTRLRKTSTTTSVNNNIKRMIPSGNDESFVKLDVSDERPLAKLCVKESTELTLNSLPGKELLSPHPETDKSVDKAFTSKRNCNLALEDSLSPNNTPFLLQDNVLPFSDDHSLIPSPIKTDNIKESESSSSPNGFPVKVTLEQLTFESHKHSDALSQSNQVVPSTGAELLQDEVQFFSHPQSGVSSPDEGMVVAVAATSNSPSPTLKKDTWLKASHETTSIVFDFRGKDVKPNVSLSPTPFGCRPARVSHKKRAGSPPRSEINGVVDESQTYETIRDDNEEDWDEMDIGADLPAISGIIFSGENVKVGRGAILETRNKKLTIQFDDQATSTFEYPSENASPSPVDENLSSTGSSFNSLLALDSLANSRLSHYSPQTVTSNTDFELGISQPNHRLPINAKADKNEKLDDDPTLPAIVPTKPEDASGWSSNNSTDILF